MKISRLESFALEKLLQPQNPNAFAIDQPMIQVLQRAQTKVGFYSIIQLPTSLRRLHDNGELTWLFKLRQSKAKGYFVCWAESATTLCLEAVISNGGCPPELSLEQLA